MTPGRDGKPCPFCGGVYCDTYCTEFPVVALPSDDIECAGCGGLLNPTLSKGLRVYAKDIEGHLVACSFHCALLAAKRTVQGEGEAA